MNKLSPMDIIKPKRGRPFRTDKVKIVSAQVTIAQYEHLLQLGNGNVSKAIQILVTKLIEGD